MGKKRKLEKCQDSLFLVAATPRELPWSTMPSHHGRLGLLQAYARRDNTPSSLRPKFQWVFWFQQWEVACCSTWPCPVTFLEVTTCWTLLLNPSSEVFTSAIVFFRALMSVWFPSMVSPFVDILILVLHRYLYFLWLTQFSYSSLSSFQTSLLNYVLEKVDLRRFILVLWAVSPLYRMQCYFDGTWAFEETLGLVFTDFHCRPR